MPRGVNRLSKNRNRDRLSNLPEVILSQILSLLPTKDAVRTSVLSRTWKNRWTSINVLEFDDRRLHNDFNKMDVTNFKAFVDNVFLRLQESRIEDMYLSCSDPYNFLWIRSWVVEAKRRKAKGIHVRAFAEKHSPIFSLDSYDCDSLENLILQTNCLLRVPETMYFSGLKFLDLTRVRFIIKCSKEICLSFPILETLILERCEYIGIEFVNINAPLLNDFTLIDYAYKQNTEDRSCILNIDGSNIATFNLRGYSYVSFTLVNPSSVNTVNIKLSSLLVLDHLLEMTSVIRDLLRQITNMSHLTLSHGTIKVLSCIEGLEDGLPTFGNLLKLELNLMTPADSATLTSLLKSMPVLETLIFTLALPILSGTLDKVGVKMVPNCSCLPSPKVIKVMEFHGTEMETELVKVLIKNAVVLEVMVIIASQDLSSNRKKFEAMKKRVRAFPRGSAELSILFA